MKENPLLKLSAFGQSIWLDYIRRQMIDAGELKKLIDDDGLKGVTSNPAIFQKAIAGSTDYDEAIRTLARAGASIEAIYQTLTVEDVQRAADLFRPLYDRLDRPGRLRQPGGQPPPGPRHPGHRGRGPPPVAGPGPPQCPDQGAGHQGGPAGHPAAHLRGHQRQRHAALRPAPLPGSGRGLYRRPGGPGGPGPAREPGGVRGQFLFEPHRRAAGPPAGKTGGGRRTSGPDGPGPDRPGGHRQRQGRPTPSIRKSSGAPAFKKLAAQGARPQRLLWASTSTKNPAYPDVKYVEPLIGADTVNTLPPETLEAYRDHGDPAARLTEEVDRAAGVPRSACRSWASTSTRRPSSWKTKGWRSSTSPSTPSWPPWRASAGRSWPEARHERHRHHPPLPGYRRRPAHQRLGPPHAAGRRPKDSGWTWRT